MLTIYEEKGAVDGKQETGRKWNPKINIIYYFYVDIFTYIIQYWTAAEIAAHRFCWQCSADKDDDGDFHGRRLSIRNPNHDSSVTVDALGYTLVTNRVRPSYISVFGRIDSTV